MTISGGAGSVMRKALVGAADVDGVGLVGTGWGGGSMSLKVELGLSVVDDG